MAKVLNNLSLEGNEIQNFKIHPSSTIPSLATGVGATYYDSLIKALKINDGSAWQIYLHTIKVGGTAITHEGAVNFLGADGISVTADGGVKIALDSTYKSGVDDAVTKITALLANKSAGAGIGSEARPVYVSSDGKIAAVTAISNDYLANSAITIAGTAVPLGGSITANSIVAACTSAATFAGNAATATKLKTSRTIWGKSFNGSANITGDMSSVGIINFSDKGTDEIGIEVKTVNGVRYLHTTLPFYSDSSVTAGGISEGGSTPSGGGITAIKVGSGTYSPATGSTVVEIPEYPLLSSFTALAARVTTLEGTTPNVAWGTDGSYKIPLSVNGTTKTLLTTGLLDSDNKVKSQYLPSYVDDVLEFASKSAFPATGESGKIYVALDTNKTYRWGGSAYVEISASLALGETSGTAYEGSKGKANADAIAVLQGYFSSGILKAANMSGANIKTALGTTAVNRATGDASGNTITSTYARVKSYTITLSGTATTYTSAYDWADKNLVATLYDANDNVVLTDMQIVTSNSKYGIKVTFAVHTTATYRLVVNGIAA